MEETLTYCDFPSEHWTRIRTNNVIERLNREIRRRTRVVGSFLDGNSALMLACARLRHVAGTQWGNKKYMNMKHLETALVKCTPSVRQYDILLTDGVIYMPKGVPNKRYTPEFKKMVVETMHREKMSYYETERQFGLPDKRVQSWERIYLEEGPEGFAIERRGRKRTKHPAKLLKAVEEDLIAENQRLRAEVAYLKNLQALVLEDERRQHKKRR